MKLSSLSSYQRPQVSHGCLVLMRQPPHVSLKVFLPKTQTSTPPNCVQTSREPRGDATSTSGLPPSPNPHLPSRENTLPLIETHYTHITHPTPHTLRYIHLMTDLMI